MAAKGLAVPLGRRVYPYATLQSIRLPQKGQEVDPLEMEDLERKAAIPARSLFTHY